MMTLENGAILEARLRDALRTCGPAGVAVSGGVDSMTLAFLAHRTLGSEVVMYHAVSPAVPPSATARVRRYAAAERWQLAVVDAGEFGDARYMANPAERCFYCKSNLYQTLAGATAAQLLSGTNLDDLGDWRPGLRAASAQRVRHPFVEAGIDKQGVRTIARWYNLTDLAELPAAPCLSSRIETGIPIATEALHFIDRAENLLRQKLSPETVRCRIRRQGIVIELDEMTLARTSLAMQAELTVALRALAHSTMHGPISFSPYARGSAFLRES